MWAIAVDARFRVSVTEVLIRMKVIGCQGAWWGWRLERIGSGVTPVGGSSGGVLVYGVLARGVGGGGLGWRVLWGRLCRGRLIARFVMVCCGG